MTVLKEGELIFTFDKGCDVGKYDEWSFYQRSFQNTAGGSKGVDFVCVCEGVAWLIEVTDYSSHPRRMPEPGNLSGEVAAKVRDTLAGLAAAATNAENADEKEIARRALDPNRSWRVALHLELPDQHSELWSKKNDLADLRLKLRAALKSVDPNAGVVDTSRAHVDMNWKSQRK